MGEIIVLKHGSSVSENQNGIGLNQDKIDFQVLQHKVLRGEGYLTAEVSSGAVVAGKEYLQELGYDLDDYDNQAFAKHGTATQIAHFEMAARCWGMAVSQILATHQEIDDRSEGKAIIQGALADMRRGSLVVLNENNAAAEQELDEYSAGEDAKQHQQTDSEADNDWLAAHFAISLGATVLLLLTNKDGFEVDGVVQKQIKTCDITDMLAYCGASSDSGKGGMRSKLQAAGKAAEAGIHVVIGSAFVDSRLVLRGAGTKVVQ